MELIRKLPAEKNKKGHFKKYGEFLCTFCLTKAKRRLENGLRQQSCGCQHYSDEVKDKISNSKKGKKIHTEESIDKIRNKSLGRKHTEETRQKIREKRKLQEPPTLGTKLTEEHKQKISVANKGENNGNWNKGSSFELYPQEFYSIRHQILERDNYTCQCPTCEHKSDFLHIHHIDYDKKNNNFENLVTLCLYCHNKTSNNSNRQYWVNYYKNIMENNL